MVLPKTANRLNGGVGNDGLLVSPSGVRMLVGERLANEARRVWVRGEVGERGEEGSAGAGSSSEQRSRGGNVAVDGETASSAGRSEGGM